MMSQPNIIVCLSLLNFHLSDISYMENAFLNYTVMYLRDKII